MGTAGCWLGASPSPLALLLVANAAVALGGHPAGSRRIVVAGLVVLFVATIALIAGAYAAYGADPSTRAYANYAPQAC